MGPCNTNISSRVSAIAQIFARASKDLCSEFGNLSMELVTIMNVSALSLFVGAIYGGVNYSRNTYVNFIKNNQATAFRDPIDAKVSII